MLSGCTACRSDSTWTPSITPVPSRSRRLGGCARRGGSGDFSQFAGSYVVNISGDRNGLGNQRMVSNALHVGNDRSRIVLHREPINKLTLRRSGAFPDIAKAVGSELCGLEAPGKKIPHHVVSEE